MNADAVATRMSVLTRALPSRILLVDDDELERELMAERLTAAGFEVARATNGQQALALLDRQWYPLVITDWQMPVMDGIALTESLRLRGVDDTYIIMLTARDASLDYERGYVSGVDDYLTKKVPDPELFARIHAAFNTLALRRSLKETQAALEQSVTIDAESGAFAPCELHGRLLSEVRRAQRYGRQLSVLTVGVETVGSASTVPAGDVLREVVQTIDATVRAHVDWIGRLETPRGAAFAIVMPEASIADTPLIKDRLASALHGLAGTLRETGLAFTVGAAALERSGNDGAPVDPAELLAVAAHCRNCNGRTGPEQLSAVQRSVACHVAIVCRHGYAVDSACSLKGAA